MPAQYKPLPEDSAAIEDEDEVHDLHSNSHYVYPPESHSDIPRSRSHHQLRPALKNEKIAAERKRYIYAAFALSVALFSFVLQTETAGYLATTLEYRKPIFTLYVTHSSWTCMWILQIIFLRVRKLHVPFTVVVRRHLEQIYSTASIVVSSQAKKGSSVSPIKYMIKVTLILFLALNVAGSSWYVAINLTTPNDLTAIYNCSAFFAYAFSVPLLGEAFRWDKVIAVLLSIVGVTIVAYSGSASINNNSGEYPYRALGNIVIGLGAVLYGLYEVLYKRLASAPSTVSVRRQAAFANVVGSCIGFCTLCLLWAILPVLHFTGIERLELPTGEKFWVLMTSVAGNMLFSGSFLILMTLTSPVLSSVAALLTTFLVPVVDWLLFGTNISSGDVVGGLIIIIAFVLLAYASWKELSEENDDDDDDASVNESLTA